MDLRLGDVVLIEVAFHQTLGAKISPAVVVLDSGDEGFIFRSPHGYELNSRSSNPSKAVYSST